MPQRPAPVLALLAAAASAWLAACLGTPGTIPPAPGAIAEPPPAARDAARTALATQAGLNFVTFYVDFGRRGAIDTTTPSRQPAAILADFQALGIGTFRQATLADLLWDVVQPAAGQWRFQQADAVFGASGFEPIATLFSLQYASPTPPWERDPARFQRVIGPEALAYLEQVVQRYAPSVRYWELGNEMDHWLAADPGAGLPPGAEAPPLLPPGGFTPQEQGRFLAQAAAIIRRYDPDAVILLPGLSAPSGYPVETWLAGVVEAAGSDWFDVVTYHYYGSWEGFCRQRTQFQAALQRLGLAHKPVWLTETGSTRDPGLTLRTNYPNSPQSQAADVVRRLVPAWALGDQRVYWHTYLDSPSVPGNDWRGYGIRSERGEPQPAWHTLQLLVREVLPFREATAISCDGRGATVVHFVRADGEERWVAWGSGALTVPASAREAVTVVPDAEGRFTRQPVRPGERLGLTPIPVILR